MDGHEDAGAPDPAPPAGRRACSHASHETFYEQATVELNLLLARNEIRTKNAITLSQLRTLKDSVAALEELHRDADAREACLGADEIGILRSGFESSFAAILRLELAKKRGEDES